MITENKIETYISNSEGETTSFLNYKCDYGVLRVELGKTNIIFKAEDLKKILGDEK